MKYLLGLSAEPINSTIDPVFEGVGMIRSEYLCRLKEEYITLPSMRTFISEYVRNVCQLFYPAEVWYRTTDLVVPEVNVLRGADEIFEEKHYLLGLRGVRRGLRYRDTFELEMANIAEVAEEHQNLGVLFPYVYDPQELEDCIKIAEKFNYKGPFGMMVETPASVFLLEEFIKLGISNITIGVNDLSVLTLGTYRGSSYHKITHPAVIEILKNIVKTAKSYHIPVSVGGYVTKELMGICEGIGADWLIIHYSDLPKVLNIAPSRLPHLELLKSIKQLTKHKREEREQKLWEKKLGHCVQLENFPVPKPQ